jgi:hypothetical protein
VQNGWAGEHRYRTTGIGYPAPSDMTMSEKKESAYDAAVSIARAKMKVELSAMIPRVDSADENIIAALSEHASVVKAEYVENSYYLVTIEIYYRNLQTILTQGKTERITIPQSAQ